VKYRKPQVPYVVSYADFKATRLIDEDLNFHHNINIGEAKRLAQNAGLDLVCFNEPDAKNLAFCKILDFGKWRYQEEKRKKKQNKEHRRETKEIRFSPVISDHDVEHKVKQVREFLEQGDDVLFTMRLKGRQRAHFSEAEQRMNEILNACSDCGKEVSRRKSGSMINVRVSKLNQKEKA
jgi:translation initiation factor IF-3